MLKRTKGYTLLLLLVLTGLAGRLFTTTISSQERRLLIDQLKESKLIFTKSVQGLTEKQLNFKSGPEKSTIKNCITQLTLTQNDLWSIANASLKNPSNPQKRSAIKMADHDILKTGIKGQKFAEVLKPAYSRWKTTDETLDAFKEKRAELIKFAKTSTDDMRNHVAQLPVGYIDSYQVILFIAAETKRQAGEIEKIKADPAFPN